MSAARARPVRISPTMRSTMAVVLPEPAPASTSSDVSSSSVMRSRAAWSGGLHLLIERPQHAQRGIVVQLGHPRGGPDCGRRLQLAPGARVHAAHILEVADAAVAVVFGGREEITAPNVD